MAPWLSRSIRREMARPSPGTIPRAAARAVFTPVGGPFLRSDEVCRAFIAAVQTQTKPAKLQGTACRPSGGDWVVKDVQPWKGAI